MKDMSRFEVKTTKIPNGIKYEFAGSIDEDAQLPGIPPAAKSVAISLAHLKVINSSGIRGWVSWLKTLPPDCEVKYMFCPQVFVDQMNMVADLLRGHAYVESLYLPYFCPSCNELTSVLVTDFSNYVNGTATPQATVACRKCKSDAELDVVPEKYFSFLKRKK